MIFSANSVHLNILCIICYRQRESIVTCEIVVIPMNSRSIVLTCIKSLLLFNHCICTFDFFYICELSFNRDLHIVDVRLTYPINITYLLTHRNPQTSLNTLSFLQIIFAPRCRPYTGYWEVCFIKQPVQNTIFPFRDNNIGK